MAFRLVPILLVLCVWSGGVRAWLNCTFLDIDNCLENAEASNCAWCGQDTEQINGSCIFYEGDCGSLINGHPNELDHAENCPHGRVTRSEFNVCRDAVYFAKYFLFVGSILCAAIGCLLWVGSIFYIKFQNLQGAELQKWTRLFTFRVHVYMLFVSFVWTFCLLLIGFLIAAALDLNGSTPAVLLGTFAAYVVIKEFSHVIYTVLAHVEKGRLSVNGLAMNVSAGAYFVISFYFAYAYQPFVYGEDTEIRLVALLDAIIVMFSFVCRELLSDGSITYVKNYIKATTDVVSGAPSRALQQQIDQIKSKPDRSGTLDEFDDPQTTVHHKGHEEVEDDTWPHATPAKKRLNQLVRVLDFGFMLAIIVELALVFENQPRHVLDEERVVASARRAYILAFLSLARTWLVETQHSYGEQRWLAGKKFQFHYTVPAGEDEVGRSVLLEVGNKNDEQVWSQLSEQLIPDNERHGYH